MKKTSLVTILCGFGHVLSSIVIGMIGIALGIAVSRLEIVEGFRGNLAAWALIAFGLGAVISSFRAADDLHGTAYYSLAFALDAPEALPKPVWNGVRFAAGVALAVGNLLYVRTAAGLIIGGTLVFGATLFLGWWGTFAYFAAVAPVLCWHIDDRLGLGGQRVVWPGDPVRRVTTWADRRWPVGSKAV